MTTAPTSNREPPSSRAPSLIPSAPEQFPEKIKAERIHAFFGKTEALKGIDLSIRERRVTAAEAFLLQLTKRGLDGDSAAARAAMVALFRD